MKETADAKKATLAEKDAAFEPLRREKQERQQIAADKQKAEAQVTKISDAKGLYDTKKGEVDTAKTALKTAEDADP